MKVILLKDVKGTGRAHEAVEVKDGHALNLLIPRGLAVAATASALKNAEVRAEKATQERAMHLKMAQDRLAALASEKLTFTKKANEQGHLYDALDAKEIAEKAQLPEDAIKLEKPIKELGIHEVSVSLGETFGKIAVEIVAE